MDYTYLAILVPLNEFLTAISLIIDSIFFSF